MGLFEINMPLLYGEGPKAFTRLQYEIAESGLQDESLFAWRDAGLSSSGMFARSPEAFADSGNICCVRNPNPRAQLMRVTRTSLFLDRSIAREDLGQQLALLTLNCAFAGSKSTYLEVELSMNASGYYVRSSPGYLVECNSPRGLETIKPIQVVNQTLQMSLNHRDYRTTRDSSLREQHIVVMPFPSLHPTDGFYLERFDQPRDTHLQRVWLLSDSLLGVRKDDSTTSTRALLENRVLVHKRHFSPDGTRMYKINVGKERPVAVMLFQALEGYFAIILRASEAVPELNVIILSSPPTPLADKVSYLRKQVQNCLQNPKGTSLDPSDARYSGADRFLVSPTEGGDKMQITLRKRMMDNQKVYCVQISYIYTASPADRIRAIDSLYRRNLTVGDTGLQAEQ